MTIKMTIIVINPCKVHYVYSLVVFLLGGKWTFYRCRDWGTSRGSELASKEVKPGSRHLDSRTGQRYWAFHLWLFLFSCLVVSNSLWSHDCSPPGSSAHGISQARILEWNAIAFCRGSSQTRVQTHISCTDRQRLYPWATREAPSPLGASV